MRPRGKVLTIWAARLALRGEEIQADQAIGNILHGKCGEEQPENTGDDVDACLADKPRQPSWRPARTPPTS
jgi:hypothetical protein